jgi:putative Holliday junction resolvase
VTAAGRLLGVDYGHIRIGMAVSDHERKIASPLATYTRGNKEREAEHFRKLIDEEQIVEIILGLPVHLDGREGQKATETRAFGKWLQETTGLPLTYWDERFTTVEAEQLLLTAGLTSKRRRHRRDRVAAQLLLQSYLDAGCPGERKLGPL